MSGVFGPIEEYDFPVRAWMLPTLRRSHAGMPDLSEIDRQANSFVQLKIFGCLLFKFCYFNCIFIFKFIIIVHFSIEFLLDFY